MRVAQQTTDLRDRRRGREGRSLLNRNERREIIPRIGLKHETDQLFARQHLHGHVVQIAGDDRAKHRVRTRPEHNRRRRQSVPDTSPCTDSFQATAAAMPFENTPAPALTAR